MTEEQFTARNHCLKEFNKPKTFIGKIRQNIFEKYGIWDVWDLFPYCWRHYYYNHIRPIFKPQHDRLRKVIPKTWMDITELMVTVNFEFIKSFYEDEFKQDIVDWEATEKHKEFADWLESAYEYITKTKPHLEIELQNAYPPFKGFDSMFKPVEVDGKKHYEYVNDDIPYEIKYKEVNRLEKLIRDRDTEILTEMIKRRDYFWT